MVTHTNPSNGPGDLFARILGIEVAATVGHSMGDIVEGMHWSEIQDRYGVLDRMLPQPDKWKGRTTNPDVRGYPFVYHVHDRPAGMSEDGHERHRLTATAVIEKQGRISASDLGRAWVRDIDPGKFGYLLGSQDQVIYYSLKAGVPAAEVGRYALWPGAWGVTAMMVPIGIVNAGDPEAAANDALDVGRIKDQSGVPGNVALEVASALAAGVASGLAAGSAVADIVEAALGQLSAEPRSEVERALACVGEGGDWRTLREFLDTAYEGRSILWPVETLGTALAVLVACAGDPTASVVGSANLGRDADGRAFAAGAMAAALNGAGALPAEWEATISEQVVDDPHTVSRRTPRETAEGLLRALNANLDGIERRLRAMRPQATLRGAS